jgi:cellulose biosynthesis protein BcsQ
MSEARPHLLTFTSTHGGTGQTALAAHVALGLARSGHRVLLVELQAPSAAGHYLQGLERTPGAAVPVGFGSIGADAINVAPDLWHVSIDSHRQKSLQGVAELSRRSASRNLWVVIDLPRHLDAREDIGVHPDLEFVVLRADPASLADKARLQGLSNQARVVLNQIDHRRPVSRDIDRVLCTLFADRLAARIHYDEAVAEALARCSNVFDSAPGSRAAAAFTELVDQVIATQETVTPIVASRSGE